MKIYESAENYLETILILTKKNNEVRSIDIANELNYSKPSISIAMKNLRSKNLIEMDEAGHITLTSEGLQIAEKMLERHHFLSEWLCSMGVDRETAVEDACRIEHVISNQSFEALKEHVEKFHL